MKALAEKISKAMKTFKRRHFCRHAWQTTNVGDIIYRDCPHCKAGQWKQFGSSSGWGWIHKPR